MCSTFIITKIRYTFPSLEKVSWRRIKLFNYETKGVILLKVEIRGKIRILKVLIL